MKLPISLTIILIFFSTACENEPRPALNAAAKDPIEVAAKTNIPPKGTRILIPNLDAMNEIPLFESHEDETATLTERHRDFLNFSFSNPDFQKMEGLPDFTKEVENIVSKKYKGAQLKELRDANGFCGLSENEIKIPTIRCFKSRVRTRKSSQFSSKKYGDGYSGDAILGNIRVLYDGENLHWRMYVVDKISKLHRTGWLKEEMKLKKQNKK